VNRDWSIPTAPINNPFFIGIGILHLASTYDYVCVVSSTSVRTEIRLLAASDLHLFQ